MKTKIKLSSGFWVDILIHVLIAVLAVELAYRIFIHKEPPQAPFLHEIVPNSNVK